MKNNLIVKKNVVVNENQRPQMNMDDLNNSLEAAKSKKKKINNLVGKLM